MPCSPFPSKAPMPEPARPSEVPIRFRTWILRQPDHPTQPEDVTSWVANAVLNHARSKGVVLSREQHKDFTQHTLTELTIHFVHKTIIWEPPVGTFVGTCVHHQLQHMWRARKTRPHQFPAVEHESDPTSAGPFEASIADDRGDPDAAEERVVQAQQRIVGECLRSLADFDKEW